jgi:RimJ/RimL family protein N-acetyltransferase
MPPVLKLRPVIASDLPLFFEFQLDSQANYMAAFTAKDPTDRAAFAAHWDRILADPTTLNRTIVLDGQVVGSVASYPQEGQIEVTYWIGKEFWGQGVATRALSEFIQAIQTARPLYAHVAKDNVGSRRVLEKCGFVLLSEDKWFANARNAEIDELLLKLT